MALPLKSGADLYNNQALRLRLHNLGADPTEVGAGLIYFNTSSDLNSSGRVRVYTGSEFKSLAFVDEIANNAEFIALQEKVALLAGDVDTDAIISNMKEVSAFLEGFVEDASLMDYLNTELGKKLDLAGGTISGVGTDLFRINRTDGNPYIAFSKNGTHLGRIEYTTNGPIVNHGSALYDILHTGNGIINKYVEQDETPTVNTFGLWNNVGAYLSVGYNDAYKMEFRGKAGGALMRVCQGTDSDTGWKIILTEGNVGDYALKTDGSNKMSNGVLFSDRVLTEGRSTIGTGIEMFKFSEGGSASPTGSIYFSTLHAVSSYAGLQLAVFGGGADNSLYYRKIGENNTRSDWKTIAFTDSTVAAAMKLVTSTGVDAVTINSNGKAIVTAFGLGTSSWSLSSAGIQGDIDVNTDGVELRSSNGVVLSVGSKGLILNEAGNVTIGSEDLAGSEVNRKLYVDGKISLFESLDFTREANNYITVPSTGGQLAFNIGAAGSAGIKMLINNAGNVLIGTNQDNASGAKLQVAGDISLTTAILTDGQELLRRYEDSLYIGYGTAVQGSLPTSIWGNEIRFINSSGQVKAYLTDDGDLHVKGNIIADGEVSAGGVGEEGSAGAGSGSQMYATTIAEGTTMKDIAHGLATDDIVISIYEKDSTSGLWNMILTDIEITDANNIRVTFGSATTVEHKVVIFGAVA